MSESQGATDRETRSPGGRRRWEGTPPEVPTSRVETLRLSGQQGAPHPPPAGNPHSGARGQAWTGAASLRRPQARVWTLAAPEATLGAGLSRDPGPPLRLQLRCPLGAGNGGAAETERDEQRQIAGERETDPRRDSGADSERRAEGLGHPERRCTPGAAPEMGEGGARGLGPALLRLAGADCSESP